MKRFTESKQSAFQYVIAVIFLMTISLQSASQRIQLSDDAEIHVLTCGPYQGELYSAFGHSAVRVSDPKSGLDWLYNYGIFSFNQPNFYLNFARGYLNYRLAVMDYEGFRDYYIHENRFIHEQILNLNKEQKQQYFDFLEWNAKPENQFYYYDYFYDNCATRIRDGLKLTFGDQIEFDGSYVTTDYTIRELTDLYLAYQPWGDLGIDLCLGLPMDVKATPEMYMFLPDYIENGFNNAFIKTDSGLVPLVEKTLITYESKPENIEESVFTPLAVFSLLLIIGIALTYYGWMNKKHFRAFDILLFGIVGSVGLLLFLLWVATDHHAAAKNMNLLWALPSHLVIPFFLFKKEKAVWLKKYFVLTSILGIILVSTWVFLPQLMHYSLIPLVVLIAVRSFNHSKR